jgi:D-serine deaminase-like pyridoxal phosphate-dependent protein
MIEVGDYIVQEPDTIETPAMLVFEEQVDHNIQAMGQLGGGSENLFPHVKTHKSAAIAAKQIAAGVCGFKCATLKELEMVLEAGAKAAVLSYPQVQKIKVERFAALVKAHADAWIATIVSAPLHLEVFSQVAQERQIQLKAMLDVDAGMRRTGIPPGQDALALYQRINADPHLEEAGLHVYDGHEHIIDDDARDAAAQSHIEDIRAFKAQLEAAGSAVPRIVCGGTFSFQYYARAEGMHGSPGTCIYWDKGYGSTLPDMPFRWAALILTQVVDRHPDHKTFTTDLGYKAIAGDPPVAKRATLLGLEEANLILQNEEHGVFSLDSQLPAVGTYLLALPGHVCPTTMRYPGSFVMNNAGEVVDYYPHTARDRA